MPLFFLQRDQSKSVWPVFLLLLVQIGFILFVFHSHFTDPSTSVLNARYDGQKNNYTLFSYVKAPVSEEGIFKYTGFTYPFGDYVFAADNTPLFSVPFRWYCQNVQDISEYALPVFNYFIIFNILLCSLLAYKLFNKLLGHTSISWVLALILPWCNIQVVRLFPGHYNLSLSSLIVLLILLCVYWHQYIGHRVKRWLILSMLIFFIVISFLIHGYYLAIMCLFAGGYLLSYGLLRIKSFAGKFSLFAAAILPVVTGLISFGIIQATDGYIQLRSVTADGYDWIEQKVSLSLFFTHYHYHRIFFPVWIYKKIMGNEAMIYLGNVGLYIFSLLFFVALVSRPYRLKMWQYQKDFFANKMRAALVFAALIILSASIGEQYYIIDNPTRAGLPSNGLITGLIFSAALIVFFCFFFILLKRKGVALPIPNKRVGWLSNKVFFPFAFVFVFLLVGRYSGVVRSFENITNPLLYAHKVTDMVEQFRALSRLIWPFYWIFYIWVFYIATRLVTDLGAKAQWGLIFLMLLTGMPEMIDNQLELRPGVNSKNVFARSQTDIIGDKKRYEHYQAILPIPFYAVGTEDGNLTIDDADAWSSYTYQLASETNLPLISVKMARVPPVFVRDILQLFVSDTVPLSLKSKMNNKPILVAVARNIPEEEIAKLVPDATQRPLAAAVVNSFEDFAVKKNMKLVDSSAAAWLYEWYLP